MILKTGDSGAEVALLQTGLRRAGFDPGAPDGVFGPATRQAVTEFQRAYGLRPDGIAGPVTEAVPASILQRHPNCEYLLDNLAASKL